MLSFSNEQINGIRAIYAIDVREIGGWLRIMRMPETIGKNQLVQNVEC
ncbi:MAG: hypothetical protein NT178_03350 [Proteobacteria bacterium]|nr:hypothetical protein [Pseudomonadota bacterium]